MTFNIGGAYDLTDDGPTGWHQRSPQAAEVLRRHRPDIVGFQEFDPVHVAWAESALPDHACLPGLPGDHRDAPNYNALAWRPTAWRLHGSGGWYLNPAQQPWEHGWGADCVRTATWAELEERSTGRRLLVVTTHLDHVSERSRMESLRMLLRAVGDQSGHDLPVVLMGDFNSNGAQPVAPVPVETTFSAALLPLATHAGYADAFASHGGPDDATAYTFHGYEGADYAAERHRLAGRLDWILTHGLTASSYRRVDDVGPPVYPSDHWPVMAELDWAD